MSFLMFQNGGINKDFKMMNIYMGKLIKKLSDYPIVFSMHLLGSLFSGISAMMQLIQLYFCVKL
jgi:hypothetical protein